MSGRWPTRGGRGYGWGRGGGWGWNSKRSEDPSGAAANKRARTAMQKVQSWDDAEFIAILDDDRDNQEQDRGREADMDLPAKAFSVDREKSSQASGSEKGDKSASSSASSSKASSSEKSDKSASSNARSSKASGSEKGDKSTSSSARSSSSSSSSSSSNRDRDKDSSRGTNRDTSSSSKSDSAIRPEPIIEPLELATVPLLLDCSPPPPAADARLQWKRRERLRAIEAKALASRHVLIETERYYRAYHGLREKKQSPSCVTESNDDISAFLQQERTERAMPPLTGAAALVARSSEVFRALARGDPLEPLVASGHLVTSSSTKSVSEPDSVYHTIRFYVREWMPPSGIDLEAALDKFARDHPAQVPFVEAASSRPAQTVRYVGMYVEHRGRSRLSEDCTRAKMDVPKTSRLLNFMAQHAPGHQWRSYDVVGLIVQVPEIKAMPVDSLFDSCGRDTFLSARVPRMQVLSNSEIVSKAANAMFAPIEAALIHCCGKGSICINAAGHGGLDTLPALADHRELDRLRCEVDRTCGKFTPLPTLNFDKALVSKVKSHYDCAAWSVPGQVSAQVIALNALYASVPGRGLHVLKDITADNIRGQGTRFGPFSGPGPAAFRNATTWACGQDNARETEDLQNLKIIGASADLWCLCEDHPEEQLSIMRSTLKLVAIARHEVGMLNYLILHSSHSYKVVIELKGLSDVAAEPNIEAQHMSSVIVQNFGRLVGTLRVAEVGARLVPAMATFHAGVIKYNGDTILRADRHLLLRLIALKIRLLDYFAVEGKTAAEVIEATQQAAESIGLESALLAARDRVERRESALNTLQSLSALLRHAHAQDEIFRAGEEAWQKEIVHEYNGTRSRRLVTVEDRESQLRLLCEARGGQLQDLPLPNGIKATDPGAKEAWCLWFRGLKTNVSAERAAAGLRASKGEAYVAARAQRETNPGLLQRVKATAQGGTFRHTLSVDAARAALEKKVFGARKGVHDYHCKVCGSSALIDLNTSQFAHTCGRKEVLIKKHDDERFILKRMQSSADIEVAAEQSAL